MLMRLGKVMFSSSAALEMARLPMDFASHQRLVRVEMGLP